MKRSLLLACCMIVCIQLFAQTNFTGVYGYSMKPSGNPPKTEANRGPEGKLILIKTEGNKYRFWLDVGLGWPSYNVGETDGTVSFANDTASFDNTFEGASNACYLNFKINNNTVHITSRAPSYNCGFGSGVTADGDYPRLKVQPPLNNDWLKKEYGQSPKALITADKAIVYTDEECHNPSPGMYFAKGDQVLMIADSDKSIYTEYIPSPGKFIYGWIKKSDLKQVGQ
jgi:hypothetical protein